jgi:hypothetical protein
VSDKKSNGAGMLVAGLVIGLGIGICGGYLFGTYSNATSSVSSVAENDRVPTTSQSILESDATDESEEGLGQFAFDQEPVMTIGKTTVYSDEINARVYMARDLYVSLYGEEPWNIEVENGQTVAEYAKATLLEEIEWVTILGEKADTEHIALTDEEEKKCQNQADDYMATLGSEVSQEFGVTWEGVLTIYEKEALADKVYNQLLDKIEETLKEEDDTQNTAEQEFEKQYQQWLEENPVETTEFWNQLVVGAVG